MTQETAIRAVISGLSDELTAYQRLLNVLTEQHHLMSRHKTEELLVLNERETQLLALLYQKAKQRSHHLRLLGYNPDEKGMACFIQTLPNLLRQRTEDVWNKIYHQFRLCQALNSLNGRLLASQRDTLNHLFHAEQQQDYSYLFQQ